MRRSELSAIRRKGEPSNWSGNRNRRSLRVRTFDPRVPGKNPNPTLAIAQRQQLLLRPKREREQIAARLEKVAAASRRGGIEPPQLTTSGFVESRFLVNQPRSATSITTGGT